MMGKDSISPPLLSALQLFSSQLLLGDFLDLDLFLTTWNDLFLLRQNHLDVARTAHVRIDSSVSSIRSTSHVGGTVHLDMINYKGVHVQTLDVRIGFCILEKLQ